MTDEWVAALRGTAAERAEATARLYDLLLRIARSELHRRSGQHRITGPEQDDLAHQAAGDALLAITAKLDQFRGESRFTTWAFKFVMLEVSTKIGRHFWRTATVRLDAEDWERLPDRLGFDPDQQSEWHDLLAALRKAVDEELTEHQRRLFVAIVLDGTPADAVAAKFTTNRNAIYKALFDARRKIRANLVANGYLDHDTSRRA